jgi:GST-like protein
MRRTYSHRRGRSRQVHLPQPGSAGIDLDDYSNVKRWHDSIDARPAAQRGVAVLAEKKRRADITDQER